MNRILREVAQLPTDKQVIARLSGVRHALGALNSVTPRYFPDTGPRLYLVNFKDNHSATHAAQALARQLYGYKSVMIWLPASR